MDRCLGKLPAKHRDELPMLAMYVDALPPPPKRINWSKDVTDWGMMANNRLGDCTAAGAAHAIQTWTSYTGTRFTPSDEDVISFYSKTCGYNPEVPDSDQGGIESDVLTWWLNNDLAGHKLDGIAALQPGNITDVIDSIYLFGGAYLGIELPNSAKSQNIWTPPASGASGDGAPGTWGGHCVFANAYGTRGIMCVTWGGVKLMTYSFYEAYCSEGYGLYSRDWIKASGLSPGGFKADDLVADMAALRG